MEKLEAEVARLKAERDAIPRPATDENDDASKAHTTALEAADHRVAEAERRAAAAEARVAEAEEEAAALERELALVAARSEKLQQQQTGPTEPPTASVVIPTLAPLALSSSPDPVVSVTLVAKETEEDVATLAVKLAETEFALATLVHSIIGGGSLPPWSSNSCLLYTSPSPRD